MLDGSTDPVQAKEYYTRKRVNGVWITGHFERKRSGQTGKDRTPPVDTSVDTPGLSASPKGAGGEDRPPFQQAAEARHAVIAAAFADAIPPEADLLPLRRALEARAKSMARAETGGTIPAIRSVTLDFESRVRTIQFVDGSRREEPFEPAATGGLNANAFP